MEIWILTAILVITIYLLISEKIPIDLTAIGVISVLAVSRILTPADAVAGFANPAVITVGAMFLISRAMVRTGIIEFINQKVENLSQNHSRLAVPLVLLSVSVASAFINNTPVVVLFIPVIISMSCRLGFSPAKYLIPMCYASTLGGACTLIGTSTNIIVSDLSAHYGYGALGMFELAAVGLPIAVGGLVFILAAARYAMPNLDSPACELSDEKKRRYLAELSVPGGSRLVNMNPCRDVATLYPDVEVVQLIRRSHIFQPCRDAIDITADDLLLVKGTPSSIMAILNDKVAELPASEKDLRLDKLQQSLVVELIVTPQSKLIGRRLLDTELARDKDIHIIAIQRSGLHHSEKQIQDLYMRTGDILLIGCRLDKLDIFRGRSDWIVVEDVHHQIVHKRKAPIAGGIFGAMVLAASIGLADIMICALIAVFMLVLTGCLPLHEAYRALQARILILTAGSIALGAAMDKTGASFLYAKLFLNILQDLPPVLILGGMLLLTIIFTEFLSNNATAVLMLPVAISTALELGVDPKPFIMAVCYGASLAFAVPIGYQTYLLVYGPGGYRFSDYLRLGLPLDVMVFVAGMVLIPMMWPF